MKLKLATLLIFISSAFVDAASARNLVALNKSEKENSSSSANQTPLAEDTNTAKKINAEALRFIDSGDYVKAEERANSLLTLSKKIDYKIGETNANIQLGTIYFLKGNYDTATGFYLKALALSQAINNQWGIAESYSGIGSVHLYKGDNYALASDFFSKAVKIQEEIGDKKGLAKNYSNIGEVYNNQSRFPEALASHLKALKLFEELKDKPGISACYSYIALIYNAEGSFDEALKNQYASLKIQKEIGDINGIALSYNNLGIIYFGQKNYVESLTNHQAAKSIREKIGDKKGIADSYYAIAEIYHIQGDYSESLKNHFMALEIEESIDYNLGIADSKVDIGSVYIKQKKYKEALMYLNQGLTKALEMQLNVDVKKAYAGLAEAHAGLGDFKNAYEFHKLYLAVKDTITNNENTKRITQMSMEYEIDKQNKIREEQEKAKEQQRKAAHDREVIVRDSFIGGFAIVLLFAGIFFRQRNNISKEKKRSDSLLLNILPEETAEELKHTGSAKTKTYKMVSVMFTDFKNFTQASEKLTPEELVKEIHECYSEFDRIIARHFIEKIKTIGDSYMCAAGLPIANTTNAVDAVQAAIEIRNFMMARKYTSHSGKAGTAFDIRIGVHTGPVVAGIVGIKKFAYDIWGDTVNIASRMESSGETGKVNISGVTYELVKDKFECTHRGKISAKNKGEIDMYFVEPLG